MSKIKLNLGCGSKLYKESEGWINVDIEKREVVPDDVQYNEWDITNMGELFPNNYADEIHAYHVVEHFYKEDVVEILKEWHRILKPGGTIHIEMPDILKSAMNLVFGMFHGDQNLINRMGVQGFYSDVERGNEHSFRKWGWTMSSFAPLLEAAGFKDIRMAPVQTHMGDLRDFRIEGTK